MSNTVIKVENLGKKYIIGHQKQEKYTALRDVISNGVKSLLTPKSLQKNHQEEYWALNDVSFEIKQGDRVGIIGRNGAGKSTLLKVLSRITEPTKGRISIKGRVASLLEVGTGFHPELTGRENIFLNGAILGMSKVEIKKKFDEIVAFAEIEKFLDTPVKRYSSGMYVRLAFAVAAHLEPEILIVDEVLAVGDIGFQKKCIGKMDDVGKEGRTVLFVSHNMAMIDKLCLKTLFLEKGDVKHYGSVAEGLKLYNSQLSMNNNNLNIRIFSQAYEMGLSNPNIKLIDHKDGIDLEASINIESQYYQEGIGVSIIISTETGIRVSSIGPRLSHNILPAFEGKISQSFYFKNIDCNLSGGDYLVSFSLKRPKIEKIIFLENAGSFSLPAKILYPDGVPCIYQDFGPVLLQPEIKITTYKSSNIIHKV